MAAWNASSAGSSRSPTPTSGRRRRPGAVAARCSTGCGPTRPTSSCTPATSCSRIPTTTPTGPSPGPARQLPAPLAVHPRQPRHRLLRRRRRPAAPPGDVPQHLGRRPVPLDLAGWRWSAPTPTCSAPPSTTSGCAAPCAGAGPCWPSSTSRCGDPDRRLGDARRRPRRLRGGDRRRRRARRGVRAPPPRPGAGGPCGRRRCTLTRRRPSRRRPTPGVVEHTLGADGGHDHRVLRPWERPSGADRPVRTMTITTPLKMAWARIVGPMRRNR